MKRLPFLRTTLLITAMELRILLTSLRGALCLLLAGAPALIAVIAGGTETADRIFRGLSVMQLQIIAPLIGLILGSTVISEEVEARTITYIFTRPVHRATLFLGRWLATALVAALLLSTSTAVMAWGTTHATVFEVDQQVEWVREFQRGDRWVEAERGTRRRVNYEAENRSQLQEWVGWMDEPGQTKELSPDSLGRPHRVRADKLLPIEMTLDPGWLPGQLSAALLGAVFYTLVTAVISLFVKRPLILGLGYAFAFEGVLANLPGSTRSLSIQHYLRSILFEATEARHWERGFEMFSADDMLSADTALLRLGLLGVLLLAWASHAITKRQFVLTS